MKPNGLLKQGLKTDKNPRGSLLQEIRQKLAGSSDTPLQDAVVLLGHVTGQPRNTILAHPSPTLDQEQTHQLQCALQQLDRGYPLPYLIGCREFQNLTFEITPEVLIPRPETETLVDFLLKKLGALSKPGVVLEVGTGSGCIIISLAKQYPEGKFFATDIHFPALLLAQQNARLHKTADRIDFLQADMLQPVGGQFDIICANLPYIPEMKLSHLKVSEHEPYQALNGGPDGLRLIRKLLKDAPELLAPEGSIYLEIDEDNGGQAWQAAKTYFPDAQIQLKQDLAGMDRYLIVETTGDSRW